ncbi:MAG: hypothetical protein QF721_01845 [Verrucomicrobiota bacterium]|jgi:hypothetical protein|nr:hypothetical protein [Verrucomicrobiota bacterium]
MNTETNQQPVLFDDTLGLRQKAFHDTRLIVFTGISGSGKSTALKFLCDHHPSFSAGSRRWLWMTGLIPDVKPIRGHRLVVVDELCHPRQLPVVAKLLGQNQTIAVASHLRSAWFWPFRLAGLCRYYSTDGDCGKISRYLAQLGVPHTAGAVVEFCRRHGTSYVDLNCILERHPGRSLDHAIHLSGKLDQLTVEHQKRWRPVMPVIDGIRQPLG